MATVTYDAQGFMIDGRRRWLVGGLIDYTRVARAEWTDRIRSARQAGLNTIVVPVHWRRHEPAPGKYDFEGDLDIAEFIRRIGAEKMFAAVRTGPVVDTGVDMGGMPSWLLSDGGPLLRSASPDFLEAAARFIGRLMEEIRDLQVAGPRAAGPILLLQSEHQWYCGDPDAGWKYLFELDRFLRENGAKCPIINSNNLFQSIEGELDCWEGRDGLHRTLRQMRSIAPQGPVMVSGFHIGARDTWGRPRSAALTPDQTVHRLAEVLAAGGQFLLSPFHGGTNFGFSAGRDASIPDGFFTTSNDSGAPLREGGGRGPLYNAVKRICTFATSFERIFAGLDPDYQPVVAAPGVDNTGTAVIHCAGSQGSLAFAFGDDSPKPKKKNGVMSLTMPNGAELPVDLRGQPVVWCLFNALVGGRHTLDYCNLSAFASVGSTFVCFGPAGADGRLSIDGAALWRTVPSGKTPSIETHEELAIVICNEAQIDAAYATENGVWIGVAGVDAKGEPIPHPNFKRITFIDRKGEAKTIAAPDPPKIGRGFALNNWSVAETTEHVSGASQRFAIIDGPQSLVKLGTPEGYAWMRIRVKAGAAKRMQAGFFEAADRLHLHRDGEPCCVAGAGPGAEGPVCSLPLRKGDNTFTFLIDNMGRSGMGGPAPEQKGLYGHIREVKIVPKVKPEMIHGAPLEPLNFRTPLWGVHRGQTTDPNRISWVVTHRRKTPLILSLHELDPQAGVRGLIVLNDEPIAWCEPGGLSHVVLNPERLARGKNTIQLAVLGDAEAVAKAIAGASRLYEGVSCITEKAEWAFAKWERPDQKDFAPIAKSDMKSSKRGEPRWWRCLFKIRDIGPAPLLFDAAGLTKGQLYLNGRNIGRYFVATGSGKKVPPQSRYCMPASWLNIGRENELMVFDEHGAAPSKCRLVYDPLGPMG